MRACRYEINPPIDGTANEHKAFHSMHTDERLQVLFERADENKDETLTKVELVAFFDKEVAQGGGQPGGPGGQGGGPGGRGPGGPRRTSSVERW